MKWRGREKSSNVKDERPTKYYKTSYEEQYDKARRMRVTAEKAALSLRRKKYPSE